MVNKKVYKDDKSNSDVILPGDPLGLPDDFFCGYFLEVSK